MGDRYNLGWNDCIDDTVRILRERKVGAENRPWESLLAWLDVQIAAPPAADDLAMFSRVRVNRVRINTLKEVKARIVGEG